MGQSAAHWLSTRSRVVNVRFAFFGTQLGCYAALALKAFQAAA